MSELIVFRDDVTIKIDAEGVAFTLGARDYKGVQCVSYQETTGALMASGYSKLGTQEAASDMYVVERGGALT